MAKKFLILIHGENYLFKEGGAVTPKGFYVTLCVEAGDAESAQEVALAMVRDDQGLAKIVNDETNTGSLSIDKVSEVNEWTALKPPGSGFAFYNEEEDDEN